MSSQPAPLSNATVPNGTASQNDLAQIIEEALRKRLATERPPEALIAEAARTMPRWGAYALWIFGFTSVGGVGSFVSTAASIWELPAQVSQLQAEIKECRGAINEMHLLLLESERPALASQPARP